MAPAQVRTPHGSPADTDGGDVGSRDLLGRPTRFDVAEPEVTPRVGNAAPPVAITLAP